jgi:hypothetical protein
VVGLGGKILANISDLSGIDEVLYPERRMHFMLLRGM